VGWKVEIEANATVGPGCNQDRFSEMLGGKIVCGIPGSFHIAGLGFLLL